MSTGGTSIYTGHWVNWSHGFILGSTITLSPRDGAILTAFIATFITAVGAQLWKVTCFILHQSRVTHKPRDGLYHQHQNLFRNANTPVAAAWSFVLQSWHWYGRTPHSILRSIPWALFSATYIVVFALLSIFGSSEIVNAAGQDRLLQGSPCGYWRADASAQASFDVRLLNDSQNAAAYARECYGSSNDALGCKTYATPNIRWEGEPTTCPFQNKICYKNNTYRMDTGLMDSHEDLGINMPLNDRLKYRRVATCSVLTEDGYIDIKNGSHLVRWLYGPSGEDNYTFSYSKYAVNANVGYTVGTLSSHAGADGYWEPIAALNRTDADIHLVYIAANSISYESAVDDPVFLTDLNNNYSYTDPAGITRIYYEASQYVNTIACADQHQLCHNSVCTKLLGRNDAFRSSEGLSPVQRGILRRIEYANVFTGIQQVINGRSGSALRASETEIEVSFWFTTGLAMLQNRLNDYVSPANVGRGTSVLEPQNDVDRGMCNNQKTQTTNGTISFSVLGLAITLVLGTLLISISLILETVVSWIGVKRYRAWLMDDKLQLQRMVFEGRGVRWTNIENPIPVTEADQKFRGVAETAESQGRLPGSDKAVGMSVIEVN